MNSSRFTRAAASSVLSREIPSVPSRIFARECAGKQIRILQDDTEIPPQLLKVHLTDVYTADANGPALHIIEPKKQIRQRGLPRPGVAHHGDGLARPDRKLTSRSTQSSSLYANQT